MTLRPAATPDQVVVALLAGRSLEQVIPLDAVTPLDVAIRFDRALSIRDRCPTPAAHESNERDPAGDQDFADVYGEPGNLTQTDPQPIVVDADPDADALAQETDQYLAARGIAPAGALCAFVEDVRAGLSYTYEELWRAIPRLKEAWCDYRLLVLDCLERVAGAPPKETDLPDSRPGSIEPGKMLRTTVQVDRWIEDGDLLSLYQQEIRSIRRLGRDQVVRLAQERDAGNRRVVSDLVVSNLRLVMYVAGRYRNRGLHMLDLIQEGSLGLTHAAEHFDWRLGYQFSTYATWWIRQAITRAIADKSHLVRLPVHIHEQVERWRQARQELEERLGQPPTRAEVAAALGCSTEHVCELERAANINEQLLSLDELVGDICDADELGCDDNDAAGDSIAAGARVRSPVANEEDLSDDIHVGTDALGIGQPAAFADGPVEQVERSLLRGIIDDLLISLSPRQGEVIRLRFGLDDDHERTLEEIGQQFGLTRERIRQIEAKALRKLQHPSRLRYLRGYGMLRDDPHANRAGRKGRRE